MQRGYTNASQRRQLWEDNDASDYSQEDDGPRSARYNYSTRSEPSSTTSLPKRPPSASKDRPSGIPRPGGQTPSRPPSALKAPRGRSHSPSSSADSQIASAIIPPVPQLPTNRSESTKGHGQKPAVHTNDTHSKTIEPSQPRSHATFSRRSTSISRSRSRSRTGSMIPEHPPPLPGSNSDSDSIHEPIASSAIAQDLEQTPKTTMWAKDRRRFANPVSSIRPSEIPSIRNELSSGRTISKPNYDQPPTLVAPGRKSSLKAPSNFSNSVTPVAGVPPIPSRIPSVTVKTGRGMLEDKLALDSEGGKRSKSRPISSLDVSNTKKGTSFLSHSGRESSRYHVSVTTEPRVELGVPIITETITPKSSLRSRNRYNSVNSKVELEQSQKDVGSDSVLISSVGDLPLPTPPLSRPDTVVKVRTPRRDEPATLANHEEPAPSKAMSSPVETILIGSAPGTGTNVTPTSRRLSTPMRPARESSVYVTSTPASTTPDARRLSEPSLGNGSLISSTKSRPTKDQEPPPTILQSLTRRASLSFGKSPKLGGTPKTPMGASTPKGYLDVEHDDTESPFGLEMEATPRVAPGAVIGLTGPAKDGANKALGPRENVSERQKNRQSSIYQSTIYSATTNHESKKPRAKPIEKASGGDADKLGSPFMGDGSPRFGIDERFRSPKKRTKSGLRHSTFNESNQEEAQSTFDYRVEGEVMANSTDYLSEGLPIATVLSSPGEARSGSHSPMVQSKRRSHYQYTSWQRTGAGNTKGNSESSVVEELRMEIPGERLRPRTPSCIPTLTATCPSSPSLNSLSSRSQFSDYSDEEERVVPDYPKARTGDIDSREWENKSTPVSEPSLYADAQSVAPMFQSQLGGVPLKDRKIPAQDDRQNVVQSPGDSKSAATSPKMQPVNKASQPPAPKQRKTNSALFRALEQPYECSPSATGTPEDSSPDLAQMNVKIETESISTGISMELPTVSSDLSSFAGDVIGSIRWSGTQELSNAAEKLFHNIEQSHSWEEDAQVFTEGSNDRYQESIVDGFGYDDEESIYSDGENQELDGLTNQREAEESPHDRDTLRMSMRDDFKSIPEPRRVVSGEDCFRELQSANDPNELQRQKVILDFYQREEDFVDTLQLTIRLFVQPLRAQHQRQWIAGLAPDIMRLFDWLDDIAHLHERLLHALQFMQDGRNPAVARFSEILRTFIRSMDLYQPYIVRLDKVTKRIISMILDPRSDFGDFVRMQSALPECKEALEVILAKPLDRLQEYIATFKELLERTPRTHSDYLSTFVLLHSMHATVSVLQEVKSREEEYELVKSLLSRVRGLPSGFKVAMRERRLLAQGLLNQVFISEADQVELQQNLNPLRPRYTNMVGTRARSGSQLTATSSNTESTSSSCRSTTPSTTRFKDSSTEYSMRSDSSVTSSVNIPFDGRREGILPFIPHGGVMVPPRAPASEFKPRTPEVDRTRSSSLYALVFTDIIILARPVMDNLHTGRSPRRPAQGQWNILDALGIFRALGVAEYTDRFGYAHLVSLDLMPICDLVPNNIKLPMFVTVPEPHGNLPGQSQGIQKARQEWFESLQMCYLNTMRSISFAPPSETPLLGGLEQFTLGPLASDASNTADLPFPKSPSQQLECEAQRARDNTSPIDNAEEEREEREFWAKKFKSAYEDLKQTYRGISAPASVTIEPQDTEPQTKYRFRSSNTYL